MEPSDRGNDSPTVERATTRSVDQATQTLAAAFSQDPFFQWLLADQNGEHRLQRLFQAMLTIELAKPDHIVDLVDDGGGVALWYEVDRWRPSKWETARLLPVAIQTYGKRLPLAGRVKAMVYAAHPSEPHRHLAFIGVETAKQGRGLGQLMLEAATKRCDEDGVAAYLENLNPRNAPLYHRAGFVDVGLIDLPDEAPPMMAMWRSPR